MNSFKSIHVRVNNSIKNWLDNLSRLFTVSYIIHLEHSLAVITMENPNRTVCTYKCSYMNNKYSVSCEHLIHHTDFTPVRTVHNPRVNKPINIGNKQLPELLLCILQSALCNYFHFAICTNFACLLLKRTRALIWVLARFYGLETLCTFVWRYCYNTRKNVERNRHLNQFYLDFTMWSKFKCGSSPPVMRDYLIVVWIAWEISSDKSMDRNCILHRFVLLQLLWWPGDLCVIGFPMQRTVKEIVEDESAQFW